MFQGVGFDVICRRSFCLDTGYAAPHGNGWFHKFYNSVTECLTTAHEVGGSNNRQSNVFKSEEKHWKKLKFWSVLSDLGRWKKRGWTRYLLSTCSSAWIRESENTLKYMVKTASHVLMTTHPLAPISKRLLFKGHRYCTCFIPSNTNVCNATLRGTKQNKTRINRRIIKETSTHREKHEVLLQI